MKKLAKALLGLVAALAMLFTGLATSTAAMAADPAYPTTTLKVKGAAAGDSFKAYRLLDATESGDNIAYYMRTDTSSGRTDADATKAAAMVAALQSDGTLKITSTKSLNEQAAEAVAAFTTMKDGNSSASDTTKFGPLDKWAKNFLSTNSTLTADAEATANADGEASFTNVQVGYYIVVQVTPTDPNATKPASYTIALVDTARSGGKNLTEITVKKDTPKLTKKVQDVNDSDSNATDNNKWQDSADHDLNDMVKFQLTGTLPSNYAAFESYKYIFHDYQSNGLTFDKDNAELKVYAVNGVGTDNEAKYLLDEKSDTNENGYEVKTATELAKDAKQDETFRVTFADLKKVTEGKLVTAEQDGSEKVADTATITIDHSTQIVVEYKSKLNKNAVIGSAGNPNEASLEYSNKYDTPDNTYETPKDKVIVFTYKVDINKVDQDKRPLAGAKFKLYKKFADTSKAPTGAKTYADDNPTASQSNKTKYADYYQVPGKVADDGSLVYEIEAEKQADGSYTAPFLRVDDGSYLLVESTVPDGYTGIEPIAFTISATHGQDTDGNNALKLISLTGSKELTDTNQDVTGDTTAGSITSSIKNTKGGLLPSTGGMGTVILYVAGVVCVAAAGLWFGLRRRTARH